MTNQSVSKDDSVEVSIPPVWRTTIKSIVEHIALGTELGLNEGEKYINQSQEDLKISRDYIDDYPDKIGPLTDAAWERSIARWMEGYWDCLIDLTDAAGNISDLVLGLKIREFNGSYCYHPDFIYVP